MMKGIKLQVSLNRLVPIHMKKSPNATNGEYNENNEE